MLEWKNMKIFDEKLTLCLSGRGYVNNWGLPAQRKSEKIKGCGVLAKKIRIDTKNPGIFAKLY